MTSVEEPSTREPAARDRRRLIAGVVAAVLAMSALALAGWLTWGPRELGGAAALGSTSPATSTTAEPTASSSPSASASVPSPSPEVAPGAAPPAPVPAPDPAVPGDRPTQPPVDLSATAEPVAGVSARLTTVESVTGVTTLPGEVGGPALRVTVEVTNATGAPLDLTGAVVNLYHGADMVPTTGLIKPGQQPFPSSVAPGGSATGRFIFGVPADARERVTVEVDIATRTPVVLFEGAAPAA